MNRKLVEIEEFGFSILKDVFDQNDVTALLRAIQVAIDNGSTDNIKSSLGETYAARNLDQRNPELLTTWQKPRLTKLLSAVLGNEAGLVRILYFDKHPNRTWSLPWHKDMTIAVKDNSLKSVLFTKPTTKSGVGHVEAPVSVLQKMLTLRIHLDDVTKENGPLEVVRGSHKNGKETDIESDVVKILANAGDVLAMRPLLSHSSGSSASGTKRHRRTLHLEFASEQQLSDGFQWFLFHRLNPSTL